MDKWAATVDGSEANQRHSRVIFSRAQCKQSVEELCGTVNVLRTGYAHVGGGLMYVGVSGPVPNGRTVHVCFGLSRVLYGRRDDAIEVASSMPRNAICHQRGVGRVMHSGRP